MKKTLRRILSKFTATVMALSMVAAAAPVNVAGILNNGLLTPVYADTEKTITGLGTGAIVNPTEPLSTTSAWSGSFVYYGNYDVGNDGTAEATKYRVLSVSSNDFGVSGGSLLLDCDSTLYNAEFATNNSNVWANSDVKRDLNGGSFLTKEGSFTAVERAAIAGSTKETPSDGDGDGWSYRLGYASLSGDKIFLLDAKEATRTGYGYSNTDDTATNRVKTGSGSWWLRSPCSADVTNAGLVYDSGSVCDSSASNSQGVSPAFNVNLSSVIFSSKISGTAGQPGAVYKLTLSDNNMEISVPDGSHISRNGNTITVPYAISGTDFGNADRVSVLITDEPYTAGEAKTEGYTYLELNTGTDAFSVNGTGTFTLPDDYSDKVCGTYYYVYILAEDVNEEKETDYASEPVLISVPSSLPKITSQPTDLSLTYGYDSGNTLTVSATGDSGHSLSYQWYSNTKDSYKGGTAVDGATSNSYTIPTGKNAGTEYYYCEVTDSAAISTVKSKAAKVTVGKKGLIVTAKDKTITYGDTPNNDGVNYSGFVNGEGASSLGGSLSYDYSYSQYGDVGNSYTITPKGLTSNNYSISFKSGKLTVEKKPVTASGIKAKDKDYDGKDDAELDFSEAALAGKIEGDDLSVTAVGKFKDVNAGDNKEVRLSGLTLTGNKKNNYILDENGQQISTAKIRKIDYTGEKTTYKTVKAIGTDATLTLPEIPEGATYAASGTVTGDTDLIASHSISGNTLSFSTNAVSSLKTAVITIDVSEGKNYKPYQVTVTITVKEDAAVSIDGGNKEVLYGDGNFTLTGKAEVPGNSGQWKWFSSAPEIAEIGSDSGEVTAHKAGSTIISAVYESDTTYGEGSITVEVKKAPLTVTAKDKSIVFGEAPTSGGVSYNGFVSGEDESSLSGELSFSFDYEKNGDVGEYSITPSGLYSDNYDISYVKGKLTVNKAPSMVTKAPEGNTGLIFNSKAQELITAGTADGGTLKYSFEENDGYSEDIPTATEAGDYTVWYKVFGDGNHNDTDAESLSVSIAEKKEEPGKDEKPVIPIPAKNIVINIPEGSPVERNSVTGEGFATDVGEALADAAGSLGKKEEGEESPAPSVEFNKDLSDEEINNYLNNPEKLTISVNSVPSDSLDSDDSRKDAAEEAGLKLANPKAMTSSVEIKIDIYADDGVHIGTVKKLDRGIDLKIDVSGFTEEVISIAKSFLIMSRHTPADKWFLSGVGEFDPETKTARKTVREFSEFAVAADSRDVIGIEAEDGLTADKNAVDSEIEKLVKDSVKAYRLLKDGEIKYDVPGEVYSVDAKIEPGRTVSQASVAIALTVNEGYRDDYLADPESQESALVELTSSEPEKPAPKPADTNTVTVTVSDNKPMDIRTEPLGEYQVTYAHEIPFFGKSKPTVENFGGTFTVSKGTESYKVTKIKINKKKLWIQITGLEGADADTVKAVKKATKGSSGLSFKVNPYYVRNTDTVNAKTKKDGSLKSVKIKINGKDYKAKKTEYDYSEASKLITFKGENLAGSWSVK